MEAARGSSAPGAVILPIGMVKVVMLMADDKALMYYQSTMRIARQWLGSGLITAEDYEKFDTICCCTVMPTARSSAPAETRLTACIRFFRTRWKLTGMPEVF